jgi:hypothetical protein
MLSKSAEVFDPDRGECSVFQCDECVVEVTMFGKPVDIALTFAVDRDGRAFDPATPDGSLPGVPGLD